MGGPTKPKKRRDKRTRRHASEAVDPRSYPVTTLSPWTYEGRVQAFGNMLRAARYGSGRRGRLARVVLTVTAMALVLLVALSLLARM